ncbi:hypothetical protein CEXT_528311 [Caerostris extrusa]|uniref:Uncharacterized protein n=1 Tax=Caerostris extrusa TaxID=172846 RepID=A0AAV4SZ37_CAEEX|nr:hypothetical protein CEXT_528311 [Caerostris extrusa]
MSGGGEWSVMRPSTTSIRGSAPGASNPELMDTTCAENSGWHRLCIEKLSDEERCARITAVIKKKDISQELYDA